MIYYIITIDQKT